MSVGNQSSSNGGLQQDAQVNIASIIDCFTVLITYILAAASFLSLGALDAGVAGTADSGSSSALTAPAQVASLHIHLGDQGQVIIDSNAGGQKNEVTVPFAEMMGRVNNFKTANPNLKTVTFSASDAVPYMDVVKPIALLKEQKLSVVFSGKPNGEAKQ